MAQYDGSIRIGTEITTKEAEKELEWLKKNIKKTASEISCMQKEMENLKVPTEKYKTLQHAISTSRTEIESLANEQQRLSAKGIGKGLDKDYLAASEAVKRLKSELQQATETGDKDAYLGIEDRLNRAKSVLQELMSKTPRPLGDIAYYYSIDKKIEDLKNNVSVAESEMRKLEESGKAFTFGDGVEEKAAKISELTQKMQSDTQRQTELQSALAAEEQRLAQIQENAVVGNKRILEVIERRKQLLKEIADMEAAGVGAGYQQHDSAKQELTQLNEEIKDYNDGIGRAKENYKKLGDTAHKSLERIGSILKKANSYVGSFARRIKEVAQKHLPFFRKQTEKTKSSLSGFGSRLRSLALSLLIFNQISSAFRTATNGIKDGFKNLYNENERFKTSVEGMKASLLTLKNALAGAFSPIVEIAIPYIQKLIGWLTEAVNLIGQFIAALTGRKTYTKAIKQSAAASEEAAEATEDETDAMNKQLSPLDKLNNLTSQQNNKKSDGGAGSGAGTGTMFEEVPIDNNILDMADKVKDVLSQLFAPLKKAWDREGKFVMDSWKYALDEIWKLTKDIGRDFLKVWQQEETVKIFENLLHIIGDIGLVVGNFARNFREAWNENETGLQILQNIRDIIGIIVQHIRNAADATVEWSAKLDFYPLLDAFNRLLESLKPAVDALSGILEDFYTMVLLPLGQWVLEEGLPELLQVFIDFNNKVDWESLRANLAEFWKHLEPFAETVGEGLIIFIDDVSDALANFLNSQEFKDFLTGIENWMDSVSPEDVANALENIANGLILLKFALFGYEALKGIGTVFSVIKKFLSFFGAGGGVSEAATTIGETAGALGVLKTALGDLAALGAGAAVFDLGIKNELIDLMEIMTGDTETADKMRERYGQLGGTVGIVKDTFDTLQNTLQGYGAAVNGTEGLNNALETAMNNLAGGMIYTDEQLSVLRERFGASEEDIEMIRQATLDANPILREMADTFGLYDATPETLEDIAYGMSNLAKYGEILPSTLSNMTEEAQAFFGQQTIDGIDYYIEKLQGVETEANNVATSLNGVGQSIEEGISKSIGETDTWNIWTGFFGNMKTSVNPEAESTGKEIGGNLSSGLSNGISENADSMAKTAEIAMGGIIEAVKAKAGIHSPSTVFAEIGKNIIEGLLNGLKSTWSSITSWIEEKINWIIGKFNLITSNLSGIKSKVSGTVMSGAGAALDVYGRSYSATPYSLYPQVAQAVSTVDIPGYATGQVIPRTMKQHLAWLGDNNRETEVVSPLSTIEQAVINAMAKVDGSAGNNGGESVTIEIPVIINGIGEIGRAVQKFDMEFFKQHGKHAFTT